MNEKHQCFGSLVGGSCGVPEHLSQSGDGGDNAISVGAIALYVDARLIQGNVDKVPGGGFGPGAAHLIGKTSDRGHSLAGTQDLENAGPRRGSELGVGDSGNEAVSFGPPSAC